MNAAREHTDGCRAEGDTTRIFAKATEQTPTESFVVTDHGLSSIPPIPETPQTFAAKLREIRYREPVAKPRQSFICITLGCHAVSDRPGACIKCRNDIEAGEFDRKPIPWGTVALFCVFVVVPCAVGIAWLLAEAFWRAGQ